MAFDLDHEIGLFLKIGDKVDFLWTRYIYVNVIAIGGFSAVSILEAWPVKILSFSFYLIFCYMNYRAMNTNYIGLHELHKGIVSDIEKQNLARHPNSFVWLKRLNYENRSKETKLIFIFGIVVIFIIMVIGSL